MDKSEVTLIGEGLLGNHSVLGLHLLGNEGDVNAGGFVQPLDSTDLDFSK